MINLFLKTWIQIYAVLLLFIAFYLESICVSSTKVPTYTFISDWQSKRPWNKRWGGSLFPELFTWYPGYRSSNVSHYYSCFKLDTRFEKKMKGPALFHLVPLHSRLSYTWCGQLPLFSKTWMITALERAWRPVVSKLRPSRQVSWQVLHEDQTVKWQSPAGRTQKSLITAVNNRLVSKCLESIILRISLEAALLASIALKRLLKPLRYT